MVKLAKRTKQLERKKIACYQHYHKDEGRRNSDCHLQVCCRDLGPERKLEEKDKYIENVMMEEKDENIMNRNSYQKMDIEDTEDRAASILHYLDPRLNLSRRRDDSLERSRQV